MISNIGGGEIMRLSWVRATAAAGGAALAFLGVAPERAHAATCISDVEIEAAFGEEVKSGVFAINTSRLGNRPLCSGLTMAQALQRLRDGQFPVADSVSVRQEPNRATQRGNLAGVSAEGIWRGTYRCNQGITGVEIALRPGGDGRLAGTFAFFPVAANSGVPSGSFAVTAHQQGATSRVVMTPGAWIKRPPNWVRVGAEMTISNGGREMSGAVKGPGCTSISLTRAVGAPSVSSQTALAASTPAARIQETPPIRTPVDNRNIEGSWKFSFDPAHPEYSASASTEMAGKHGVKISLFIDCSVSTIQMTAGYETNSEAPSPMRSAALDYMRRVMSNPTTLLLIKDGREIDRFTWHTDGGGHMVITPARMRLLLTADQLRLAGGTETIPFSTSNLREAVAGVMRQCKFRL